MTTIKTTHLAMNENRTLASSKKDDSQDPQESASVLLAIHNGRKATAETLNLIRKIEGDIIESTTYRDIYNSYKRMHNNRQQDAALTFLSIIGTCLSLTSVGYDENSMMRNSLTGIGTLFEKMGTTSSKFVEAYQPEIEGLIKRLEEIQRQAQREDQEVQRILERIEQMQSDWMRQLHDAQTQMMRNSQ